MHLLAQRLAFMGWSSAFSRKRRGQGLSNCLIVTSQLANFFFCLHIYSLWSIFGPVQRVLSIDYGRGEEERTIRRRSCYQWIDFYFHLQRMQLFAFSRSNGCSRRSLGRYRMSARDNFEPQLKLAVCIRSDDSAKCKSRAEWIWLQHGYLLAFNSTQKWAAELKRESGFKVVTNWADSENLTYLKP
jgi:hypothetical protein